jgi:hypothetical protein
MLTHTPVPFTMLVAMLAFFIGEIIAATQPASQSYWKQMFFSIVSLPSHIVVDHLYTDLRYQLIMPFGMDMSFPSGSVILSNHMPPEHQGLAASLVNTVVNYSISIGLGIAGTVEVQVNKRSTSFEDVALGIQCARYTGVILSAIGVILGLTFWFRMMVVEGWKVQKH